MFIIRKKLTVVCVLLLFISILTGLIFLHSATSSTEGNIFDNCDSISDWYSGNGVSLNISSMQEGSGCLSCIGNDFEFFSKSYKPFNSKLSVDTGCLQLWLYINDPDKIGIKDGQIELGSGGTYDVAEYNWSFALIKPQLKKGWNLLTLRISDAGTTGGTPDLSRINWFRIYNWTAGGDSLEMKIDNISFVNSYRFDNCDSTLQWGTNNTGYFGYDIKNKKEGAASITSTGCNYYEFHKQPSSPFSSNVTASNGALQFWYYIDNPTNLTEDGQVEIGSGGACDINEYNWSFSAFRSGLASGWNFISLKLIDAEITGEAPDLKAINWFRVYNKLADGITVTTKVDDIRLVYMPVLNTPPPLPSTTLDNCESSLGWSSNNELRLDTSNQQEGMSCLSTQGYTLNFISKTFPTPVNSNVSVSTGCLQLWLYVEDPSRFRSMDGQIEVGSGGIYDVDEYNWSFTQVALQLKRGWNLLTLRISDARTAGGTPDLNAINWFRIYGWTTDNTNLLIKIDAISFVTAYSYDDCDSITGWITGTGNDLNADKGDRRQGTASIKSTESNSDEFYKKLSNPISTNLTQEDGALQLWFYIDNPSNLADNGHIEVGSGGTFDVNEYSWTLSALKINLAAGWNFLTLRFNDAVVKGGTPDLNSINWFRFQDGEGSGVQVKMDDIRFVAVPLSRPTPESDSKADSVRVRPEPDPRVITPEFVSDDIIVADFIVTDAPYYADPDGKKDCTQAIQQAIEDCTFYGGGTVWIPAGTYRITGQISVNNGVTLRGDWNDPDTGSGQYGTVIKADVPSDTAECPGLFRVGGNAGVKGLTVYYPNQSASSPVAYPYTFEIPSNVWSGSQNYMMSSIINVTLLNSFRGICASLIPTHHEMHNLVNIKGTVLNTGMELYNCADTGIMKNIIFKNTYWANAGSAYKAPSLSTLNAFTRAHSTAFKLGDLEWEQIYNIQCDQYNVGIQIVNGQRIDFSGEFFGARITNCNTALRCDDMDYRWGISFTRSILEGSSFGINNLSKGYVKLCDTMLTGATMGDIITDTGGSPSGYTFDFTVRKPSNTTLYNVKALDPSISNVSAKADHETDDTQVIQDTLDYAGSHGGGIVYMPAGWYRINGHLTVPANVELRGSSSVPTRDNYMNSSGTVLWAYEGKDTANPDTDPALITLNGDGAGIRGLRVFYPENNPADIIHTYPYAVRGNGSNLYLINVCLINPFNGVDFKTNRCDNHHLERVLGCSFNKFIHVGASNKGWIEGCLGNATYVTRVGFGIPGWVEESKIFEKIIYPVTKVTEQYIIVDGASDEHLLNIFTYGVGKMLVVRNNAKVMLFNGGCDGGGDGITVESGNVTAVGMMKLSLPNPPHAFGGGTPVIGNATVYNLMELKDLWR